MTKIDEETGIPTPVVGTNTGEKPFNPNVHGYTYGVAPDDSTNAPKKMNEDSVNNDTVVEQKTEVTPEHPAKDKE